MSKSRASIVRLAHPRSSSLTTPATFSLHTQSCQTSLPDNIMAAPSGEVRRVADVVLERILDGSYPAGLRLPAETELATALACGRSTVREALRHLADQGLLQSRRGSGARVLDYRREGTPALLPAYIRLGRFDVPPPTLARELLSLRATIACEAVRLATRYAKPAALAEARERLERAPGLERDPAAHALNELEIFRALILASELWPAAWMLNSFWAPLRELHGNLAPALGSVNPRFQRAMERLFAHIEAGKEDAAVAHARKWFASVDDVLVRAVERYFGPAPKATRTTTRSATSSATQRAIQQATPPASGKATVRATSRRQKGARS
ncbi:MAG: FadR family transcriptional regulator [Myxococcales bacterium]|nr:FadR family transcriptional regulator [Myxococcales bacterium]